ncbi:MAG: prepilin-type N-terminal cleavage/methylation domain-containing protein [Candidatus Brocadiae bacterium]|nr:prepilin-type N-terminal cleavage/methylation domain-containing protein [Candidatus Brocadiia bacterium]
MRSSRGFTIVELLVVLTIIAVLAALLLPALSAARCRSKHSTSQATIQDFSIALKAYESDFGRYPPSEGASPNQYITNGGAGTLAFIMSAKGPKNVPYYEFRSDQYKGTQWVTALRTPYKYRENASVSPKAVTPDPTTMMNVHTFDMWACGCNDQPACSETTSEPPTAATLKNW